MPSLDSPMPMTSRPRAVFFGELLMRLATIQHERLVQARRFEVTYTGAEANAAVTLAQFGVECAVVSAVPDTEIGQACINALRQFGVNTDEVRRCGTRLGTFYLETGASQRPSKVIYDRAGSAFAGLGPGSIDWAASLRGRQWFHWSGITPALAPNLPGIVADAGAAARDHGLTVSCDLNFRSTLWTPARARAVMPGLMRHVDVLIGNEEHIAVMLGVAPPDKSDPGADEVGRCTALARRLHDMFGFRQVAITLRGTVDATQLGWRCLLSDRTQTVVSRPYHIVPVDRVGAGDAFAGGLIYGLLSGLSAQETVEFAAAAGCLKHCNHGDFGLASKEEVLALVAGQEGSRIRR